LFPALVFLILYFISCLRIKSKLKTESKIGKNMKKLFCLLVMGIIIGLSIPIVNAAGGEYSIGKELTYNSVPPYEKLVYKCQCMIGEQKDCIVSSGDAEGCKGEQTCVESEVNCSVVEAIYGTYNGLWGDCVEVEHKCDEDCDGTPETCSPASSPCNICPCTLVGEKRECDTSEGCAGEQECTMSGWSECESDLSFCDTDCDDTPDTCLKSCREFECIEGQIRTCNASGCQGIQECTDCSWGACFSEFMRCDTDDDGVPDKCMEPPCPCKTGECDSENHKIMNCPDGVSTVLTGNESTCVYDDAGCAGQTEIMNVTIKMNGTPVANVPIDFTGSDPDFSDVIVESGESSKETGYAVIHFPDPGAAHKAGDKTLYVPVISESNKVCVYGGAKSKEDMEFQLENNCSDEKFIININESEIVVIDGKRYYRISSDETSEVSGTGAIELKITMELDILSIIIIIMLAFLIYFMVKREREKPKEEPDRKQIIKIIKEELKEDLKHEKELSERKRKLEDQKRRLKELEDEGYGEDEEFKELKKLIEEEERKLQDEYR